MSLDHALIEDLARRACRVHSGFQIRQFMLNRTTATEWGVYQQALREISSRWTAQKHADIDLREAQAKLETAESFDAERLALRIEDLTMSMAQRAEELRELELIARPLYSRFKDLRPEAIEAMEAKEWVRLLGYQASLEIRTTGRVAMDTLRHIQCLEARLARQVEAVIAQGNNGSLANPQHAAIS